MPKVDGRRRIFGKADSATVPALGEMGFQDLRPGVRQRYWAFGSTAFDVGML